MNRRGFLSGVAGFLAAPAIVRAGSLMPVSVVPSIVTSHGHFWLGENGNIYEWTGGLKAPGSYDAIVERWRLFLAAPASMEVPHAS